MITANAIIVLIVNIRRARKLAEIEKSVGMGIEEASPDEYRQVPPYLPQVAEIVKDLDKKKIL